MTVERRTVFTVEEIATMLRVAPRTVTKWFDSDRLRGYRVPGTTTRYVPKEQLLRFVQEHNFPVPAELTEG